MGLELINIGTSPNDGQGDPLRVAFEKTNTNFLQLFSTAGITGIAWGNTTLNITGSNGNIAMNVGGTSNVVVVKSTGLLVNSDANITGLTTLANASITGDVNSVGTFYTTADLSGNVVTGQYALDGGNLNVGNLSTTQSLSVVGSVLGPLTITGNASAANINTAGKVVGGQVSATGNVTAASFLIGDGGFISNITVSSNVAVSRIANGTSVMAVEGVNGDITISVAGTGNVAAFTNAGANIAGILRATGNINSSNSINAVNGVFTGNVTISGNLNANIGTIYANGAQIYGNDTTGNDSMYAGLPVYTPLGSNVVVQFAGNANSYSQINFQNINSGNIASTDYIATADTGDDTNNYIDIGIGSSTYDHSDYPAYGALDSYVLGNGGNLLINAATSSKYIKFIVGGTSNSEIAATMSNSSVNIIRTLNAGNLATNGYISATGTVSASGNIQGDNFLTSGIVDATGNITGGNVLFGSGVVSGTGNISGGNLLFGSGVVSGTGNISGNYLLGNIAFANGYSASKIYNGTSEVNIGASNGNANISINGTSNVAVISDTGMYVTGVTSVSGNITGGNLLFGSGVVSGTGNISGANVNTTVASVTGNVIAGNLTTAGIITVNSGDAVTAIVNGGSNAVGNIGSSTTYFNRLFAQATTALYADLAEVYSADATYQPGTVVSFGGEQEITVSTTPDDRRVAGVISTNPSHTMNAGLVAEHTATVALTGRVPTLVLGPIKKGDMMVSAGNGYACASSNPALGTVIGKSLVDFDEAQGTVEIVVGRL